MYGLIGTAEPPRASGKILRDISCKTQHVEVLTLNNWLKVPQRFRRILDVKADKGEPYFTLEGQEYVVIPGMSDQEYRLVFQSYKECVVTYKVGTSFSESKVCL